MALTIEEMVQRVGEDLSLVPIGQALESQDSLRIQASYNEVYDRIKNKGYAIWPLAGDIPNAIVPYLALIIEEKLLVSYSVSEARYNRIKMAAGENGEIALTQLGEAVLNEYDSIEDNEDY